MISIKNLLRISLCESFCCKQKYSKMTMCRINDYSARRKYSKMTTCRINDNLTKQKCGKMTACRINDYLARRKYSKMTAWQVHNYSANIEESVVFNEFCETPIIQHPNEMLIKVLASSVNPIDVRMASGYGHSLLSLMQVVDEFGVDKITYDRLPLILGRDFSGVVVKKGHNVSNYRVGDEVWGSLPPHRQGAHAQFVTVKESNVYGKPRNVSHAEAAALPYVALTAWSAICTVGRLNEGNALGKRVLILGGSGGVGLFACQLLKTWGAHVTTTCSSDAIEFVSANTRADHCIDYNTNELISYLGSFDFVLNAASPGPHRDQVTKFAIKYLRKRKNAAYVTLSPPLLANTDRFGVLFGSVVSLLQATQDTAESVSEGTSARWAFYCPNREAMRKITKLVEEERITPVIDQVLNFNDLPQAYSKVSSGHSRGKTVIEWQKQ